ncbi:nuclear transport factor 2 family protein [Aurantiacibacter poecillastricola]|uniref:nuclear transport factor 2 family protein n=1 Tax=Aurantiacibacter poecillastricola TaxID=3064385 RepID=UPI00273D7D25|nr:nuclear transport factor 2 family protein [Aurantiacibacter sp. 219JJ12-13]MDP5262910.1 nuclear transport factor 2 family protein [Aurantiacibacter sp. 219JJ12-13]
MMRLLPAIPALLFLAAVPAVAQDGERELSLEERVQRAEDDLAIRRLLVDYSRAQDARDFSAFAALFAEQGEWVNGDLVYRGPDAILDMLVSVYGEPEPGFVNRESLHITSNIEVDVDGDRANAHSRHLLIMRGPNGEPTPALAGRYEDELIREDGRWKFLRRVDYPVMPTPAEWRAQMQALRSGE